MQATLPVRTFNATWFGLVALMLAATIAIGAALAFGISRGVPAAVEQPGAQVVEQSVLNHVADERANSVAAPAPVLINPNADDKVGTTNQAEPEVAGAGARGGHSMSLPH